MGIRKVVVFNYICRSISRSSSAKLEYISCITGREVECDLTALLAIVLTKCLEQRERDTELKLLYSLKMLGTRARSMEE